MQDSVHGGNFTLNKQAKGNPKGNNTRGNYTIENKGGNHEGGNFLVTGNGGNEDSLESMGLFSADKDNNPVQQFGSDGKMCNMGAHKKQGLCSEKMSGDNRSSKKRAEDRKKGKGGMKIYTGGALGKALKKAGKKIK